jgi:hypothetical protein
MKLSTSHIVVRGLISILLLTVVAILAPDAAATGTWAAPDGEVERQTVPPSSPSYRVKGVYGASAGGTSTSGGYALHGTLGQPTVARSHGDVHALQGGIWWGIREYPSEPTTLYLPLVANGWGAAPLDDAPDTCPGERVAVGSSYEEDFDHENDNDWWTFEAQAGETYTVRTFDLGPQGDTVLELYAGDCVSLLEENDDCSGDTLASCITWQAPATGDYHLMVRHYDWQITGPSSAYTLSIERGTVTSSSEAGDTRLDKPAVQPTPMGLDR